MKSGGSILHKIKQHSDLQSSKKAFESGIFISKGQIYTSELGYLIQPWH